MGFKKLLKEIKATNEIFDGLKKSEKRIWIAQDVLDRIKFKNLIPTTGVIVGDIEDENEDESLKTYLNKPEIQCEVCAKGALFCSFVGRVNDFTIGLLNNDTCDTDKGLHLKLQEIFSIKQLALIETAFEGELILDHIDVSYKEVEKAKNFYYRYDTDKKRLKAICKNIIKNKGYFKP